jgi:hypothetical protein
LGSRREDTNAAAERGRGNEDSTKTAHKKEW